MIWIYWIGSFALLALSILPCAMTWLNLRVFSKLPALPNDTSTTSISVLIPARNEEKSIATAIASIRCQSHSNFELLVLDDHSTDGTASIVAAAAAEDQRIGLVQSAGLPDGWNGKQHACWQLANQAHHDTLLFLDADVRLSHVALQKLIAQYQISRASLLSGFPRQETGTWSERLLIPLMYNVLLGYLPLTRSRQDNSASLAAGCGQLFLTNRHDYFLADGHRAIASSRHDGIQLPRTYRRKGLVTDVFDAQDIAVCRMYHDVASVTRGLLKNASEGVANSRLILLFTILLTGAFVLPVATLAHAIFWSWPVGPTLVLAVATFLSFLPRYWTARRFESSLLGAIANPIAVTWFIILQWVAFIRTIFGWKSTWRGRSS